VFQYSEADQQTARDRFSSRLICIVSAHRNVSCTHSYPLCLCTIISHNGRALKRFQNIVFFFFCYYILFRLPTHCSSAVCSCTKSWNIMEKNRIFSFRLLYHIVLLFACYGTWVQHLSIILIIIINNNNTILYNSGKYKMIHKTKNLIHFVKSVKSETNYRK